MAQWQIRATADLVVSGVHRARTRLVAAAALEAGLPVDPVTVQEVVVEYRVSLGLTPSRTVRRRTSLRGREPEPPERTVILAETQRMTATAAVVEAAAVVVVVATRERTQQPAVVTRRQLEEAAVWVDAVETAETDRGPVSGDRAAEAVVVVVVVMLMRSQGPAVPQLQQPEAAETAAMAAPRGRRPEAQVVVAVAEG